MNPEPSADTNAYKDWSNDALIARVTELEKRIRDQNKRGLAVRNASPASSLTRLEPPKKKARAKKTRAFEPSRYNTRFIALKLAYLGHKYNGFEAHVGNPTRLPTIEEVLWKALVKTKLIFQSEDEEINWEGCEYSKCGRTDKGVSAFGQVVGLRVRSNRPKHAEKEETAHAAAGDAEQPEEQQEPQPEFDDIHDELPYPHLLNRVLPPDVRILAWCPDPPPGFSARFSCRQRKYRYFFTQPAWSPTPMTSAQNGQSSGWLDIEAMSAAAKKYEGVHDFRNFCKLDPARQITNFERCIERAEIVPMPEKRLGLPFAEPAAAVAASSSCPTSCVYSFDISGSAFLWHQVRCLVGVLFLVGQGFEKPDIVDRLLDVQQNPRRPVYEMADDRPLVLWDCIFPASDEDITQDALHWVYPGDQKPTRERYAMVGTFGEGRYGPVGITEVLWEGWHAKKIDEVLVGELLNIAQTLPSPRLPQAGPGLVKDHHPRPSARLFDGSGTLKSKGNYVPLMRRDRIEAPDVLNARWLENNRDKVAKKAAERMEMNGDADG